MTMAAVWAKAQSLVLLNINKCMHLDKETEKVIIAPTMPKESRILWETKEKFWKIDWSQIWHEIKYWEPPWQYMKPKEFAKSFFIALVLFLASIYDVFTDG